MATEKQPAPPAEQANIARILTAANVRDNFEKMLGGPKAQAFITSVLQIVSGNTDLQQCDPLSVYYAAATAATMDLSINQNLGFAAIVPYNGKAQFQVMWKGFVQLGHRTGQYERINAQEVYENQFKSYDKLTEELDADFTIDGTGTIVGYVGYFKLLNGFKKTVYWPRAKVEAHMKKYSKSWASDKSQWKKDFDSMALKTVVKHILSKWGVLSVEMQLALRADQGVIKDDQANEIEYPDNDDGKETLADKSKKATDATTAAIKKQTDKANGNN